MFARCLSSNRTPLTLPALNDKNLKMARITSISQKNALIVKMSLDIKFNRLDKTYRPGEKVCLTVMLCTFALEFMDPVFVYLTYS